MPLAKTLMVQGTASDVGKSVLVTALCRLFAREGLRVAPFKAQNMALNAYVTEDGLEIARIQGVQAEAAGIPARVEMNPILLKPTGEQTAQVVLLGRPLGNFSARAYRAELHERAWAAITASLRRLCEEFDLVIIEGAGSPAEINLKDRDLVNMRVAEHADAPVLLVGDIDRGGVFAAFVGTLACLTAEEARRVAGFVINKFRGDRTLLEPGLRWLEARTGKPVFGVLPYLPDLAIDAEDSVALERRVRGAAPPTAGRSDRLDIAVLVYPRMANFPDVDPLEAEPDCRVRYVTRSEALGDPDLVVLPGSKNTAEDLAYLVETGLAEALRAWFGRGTGTLFGLCGGFQMLGLRIADSHGVEAVQGTVPGLGWLPVETELTPHMRTVRTAAVVHLPLPGWQELDGLRVDGYELHMGVTRRVGPCHTFLRPANAAEAGDGAGLLGVVSPDGRVWGTYVHDLFHNDRFRRRFLNGLRVQKGLPPVETGVSMFRRKEETFDRLADAVAEHLDLTGIRRLVGLAR